MNLWFFSGSRRRHAVSAETACPVFAPARDGRRLLAPQSQWGRYARKVLAAWLALVPFIFYRAHHRARY